jgi:AAA+ superfamily predicted ATPase
VADRLAAFSRQQHGLTMTASDFAPYHAHDDFLQDVRLAGELILERAFLLRRLEQMPVTEPQEPGMRAHGIRQQRDEQTRREIAHVDEILQGHWQMISERIGASVQAEVFVPWIHLTSLFQLSWHEQQLLVCALLGEFGSGYRATLRALAPDASADASDDNLVPLSAAVLLLGGGGETRSVVRQCLTSDAMLLRWQLIELVPANGNGPLSGGYRLTAAIAAYLTNRAAPQLRLTEALDAMHAESALEDHLVEPKVKQQLGSFVSECGAPASPLGSYLLHLQGPDPVLESSLCAACFGLLHLACVRLDGRAIWQLYLSSQKNRSVLTSRLRTLCRDALLCNRVLVLVNCQWLSPIEQNDELLEPVLNTLLESQRYLAVLNGPAQRLADLAYAYTAHNVVPVLIKSAAPTAQLREQIWQRQCARHGVTLTQPEIEKLVNGYLFTEQQVDIALKDAAGRRILDIDHALFVDLLFDACREQSNKHQLGIAEEVKTPHGFDDIVLPDTTRRWLREVLHYAQNRHRVIEDWGFSDKHQNSKNLCILFHGPSGTGKTMAASIIANELNLGLYKIDLSSVMSKYIGETEKNLAQLFDKAEAMNIVLFFDEAESLFSKRTETKDAHDRYANLQTGYLLQRIENYAGIVILSTNLVRNIDKAFTRRFRFMIEYPFPGSEQRQQLWHKAFPRATPLDGDLDFVLLAERAALSGGNINNIAVRAAFYASADQQAVAMRHVLKATEREYDKLGKVFSVSDFRWMDDD